jgi:hypothetical protein
LLKLDLAFSHEGHYCGRRQRDELNVEIARKRPALEGGVGTDALLSLCRYHGAKCGVETFCVTVSRMRIVMQRGEPQGCNPLSKRDGQDAHFSMKWMGRRVEE